MSLKFDCKACGGAIIVKFLKEGDIAKCRNCGVENNVPKDSLRTEEKPAYLSPVAPQQELVQHQNKQTLRRQIYDPSDYAGFWRRFSAHFLDGLVLTVLFTIARLSMDELAWLIMSLFSLLYLLGMKAVRGGTLSYLLLGIKIISIDGKEVSFRQILIRSISTIFSTLSLGIGFVWMAFDKYKQAWHDRIAGTYVILEDAKPVSAISINRKHPIKTRLFVALSMPLFALVLLCTPGAVIMVKTWTSEPYQKAKHFAKESPVIRQEIGKLKAISPGFGYVWGDSAEFTFFLFGDKTAVRFESILIKREETWEFKKAYYVGEDSNLVMLEVEKEGR